MYGMKYLFVLALTLLSCSRPAFHYMDWVVVTDGFYKDQVGWVKLDSCPGFEGSYYTVHIPGPDVDVCIRPSMLKHAELPKDGNG